jgi:hypothetical protein
VLIAPTGVLDVAFRQGLAGAGSGQLTFAGGALSGMIHASFGRAAEPK